MVDKPLMLRKLSALDEYLGQIGEYGVYPSPPFEIVFDPTSTQLDTRPPLGSPAPDE